MTEERTVTQEKYAIHVYKQHSLCLFVSYATVLLFLPSLIDSLFFNRIYKKEDVFNTLFFYQ